MHVRADAHAGRAPDDGRRPRRNGRRGGRGRDEQAGALQIGRGGDLERTLGAGHQPHRVPRRGEERRVIRVLDTLSRRLRVRRFQRATREPLRRLRGRELRTIQGAHDETVRDPLERVHDRQARHGAGVADHGLRHGVDHLGRGQRARSVVHEHCAHVPPQRRESGGDGFLPRRASGDHAAQVGTIAGGREQLGLRVALVACGRDDDDLQGCRREHAVEGVPQDGAAVDADERLGRSGLETGAGTGGDDDDRGMRDGEDAHSFTLPAETTEGGCRSTRLP